MTHGNYSAGDEGEAMSDTPITDASEFKPEQSNGESDGGYVPSKVSRQLERELAAANARLADLRRLAEKWRTERDFLATGEGADRVAKAREFLESLSNNTPHRQEEAK